MTHVYERYFIKCPYVRARQYLRESLAATAENRAVARLPLVLPLSVGGSLEKTVLVTYERASDSMHFDEPWRIRWTPEGGGPYPDFDGILTVRADESYREAVLELRGEYSPPLGALGRAFDLVAGAKIAAATARELLARIGEDMVLRYRQEESSKATQS